MGSKTKYVLLVNLNTQNTRNIVGLFNIRNTSYRTTLIRIRKVDINGVQ